MYWSWWTYPWSATDGLWWTRSPGRSRKGSAGSSSVPTAPVRPPSSTSPPATSSPAPAPPRSSASSSATVDVFELRPRIGMAGVAMAEKLPRRQTVLQTVLTAAYGMTAAWHEDYEAGRRAARPRLPRPPRHDRLPGPQVRHPLRGRAQAHAHRPRPDDRPRAAAPRRARRGPRPRRPGGPRPPPRPARPRPASPPR